jgi:2-iminobutanoate/2-iminopropanoate deaminase
VAEKEIVRTERAPAPFQGAPYNQAVKVGGLVFVAGQLGLRPGAHEMVGPSIAEQTEQVMQNLSAILEEAGSSLDRLVKTTVFLRSLDDFAGMNEVYAAHVVDRRGRQAALGCARRDRGCWPPLKTPGGRSPTTCTRSVWTLTPSVEPCGTSSSACP